MEATTTHTGPYEGLLDLLEHAEYEVHEHEPTYTALATARAEHVRAETFAKVVAVATDDGRHALLVLDAPDHVDLRKARHVLGARHVRLLSEDEMTALTPACEAGAVPAAGVLFDLPMYVDYAIRSDPAISFNAGSHRFSVRVDRVGWEKATGATYADLAEDAELGPAWALS